MKVGNVLTRQGESQERRLPSWIMGVVAFSIWSFSAQVKLKLRISELLILVSFLEKMCSTNSLEFYTVFVGYQVIFLPQNIMFLLCFLTFLARDPLKIKQ